MANVNQAALDAIDSKGNIVLKEFGDTAVLFRPQNSYEPYVVASEYDKSSGEWSFGSYFSDLGHAWEKANPDIIEDACIRWQKDDIEAALSNEGYAATEANLSWMSNSRVMGAFHDVLTEEGNERLGYLVQDEDRYLDKADCEHTAPTSSLDAKAAEMREASNALRGDDGPGIDPPGI